jgi:hypothetical protein
MISKVLLISAAILVTLSLYSIFVAILRDSPTSGIPVFADHGQEIILTLHNSSFGSLTSGGGNQVSVFANYQLNDNSISGRLINAVMEVYAPNGTLIRTSSYPNGSIAQGSGGVEGLETTIRDPGIQSVIANVTFRDLNKTAILSNDLRVNLDLAAEGAALTTAEDATEIGDGATLGEPEQSQDSSLPQEPNQEESETDTAESGGEEDGNEGESEGEQTIPSVPLFG